MSGLKKLKENIEAFCFAAKKVSEKINEAGDIWRDSNYASLQKQMGELAKSSKAVIESGERTCESADKFFAIAYKNV